MLRLIDGIKKRRRAATCTAFSAAGAASESRQRSALAQLIKDKLVAEPTAGVQGATRSEASTFERSATARALARSCQGEHGGVDLPRPAAGYQKLATFFIMSAKREDTQRKRLRARHRQVGQRNETANDKNPPCDRSAASAMPVILRIKGLAEYERLATTSSRPRKNCARRSLVRVRRPKFSIGYDGSTPVVCAVLPQLLDVSRAARASTSNLFVVPEARQSRYGASCWRIARIAGERSCGRLEWSVPAGTDRRSVLQEARRRADGGLDNSG